MIAKRAEVPIRIILVALIAITILILGTSFISRQFATFSGSATMVQKEVKEQVMEDLRSGESLTIPSSLKIEKSKPQDFIIGVYNQQTVPLNYEIKVELIQKQNTAGGFETEIDFFYYPGPFSLQPSEGGINLIRAEGKEIGNYLVKISIIDQSDGKEYASKSFFLEVK